MFIDDEEVVEDDVMFPSDLDDEERPESIRVRFMRTDGQIKGRVTKDVPGKARAKIVFPAREWVGALPNNGEELAVLVRHETKPEDPRRGVLFVQRDLPKVRRYNGAQYAECIVCGPIPTSPNYSAWTVRVIPEEPMRALRIRYPICERCGLMHELDAKWL